TCAPGHDGIAAWRPKPAPPGLHSTIRASPGSASRSWQMKRCTVFACIHDQRGFSIAEQVMTAGVAITGAVAVVAVTLNTIANFRINGDAHAIVSGVSVAKMRAAANFTRSRLYVDLYDNSFHVETWGKSGTPGWIADGATQKLSKGV